MAGGGAQADPTSDSQMNPTTKRAIPFSNPVELHRLPHLADFCYPADSQSPQQIDNVQNKTKKNNNSNPIEENPFYHHPSESDGFYVSPTDVVLRHIVYDYDYHQHQDHHPVHPHQLEEEEEEEEDASKSDGASAGAAGAYHRAGPRRQVVFSASTTKAAIVTCGGLCPGLNTVVRELVLGLWDLYGVREIYGIKAGYRGFYSMEPHLPLNPKLVHNWHKNGGTLLQTSRGGFDLPKIVDAIQNCGYNQVYIIGGDGTMRGAVEILHEIWRRKLKIAVTGIPKTVDNDVGIIDRSFGFQTAVERAQEAISAAHVEAESAVNGIGLVKLMGRSTGHIALHATLSSRDVDCCLIPETPFYLQGKGGLFEFLENRLRENGHAVLVVAEGAGQDQIAAQMPEEALKDESGNPALLDVGSWLKTELNKWWKREHPKELFTVKYIDPTYMIRAVPANATDNLYCTLVAHSAIHGVMAGYTGFVSGPINGNYVYIPLEEVAKAKNEVDTRDHKWAWVRSVTNQPDFHG